MCDECSIDTTPIGCTKLIEIGDFVIVIIFLNRVAGFLHSCIMLVNEELKFIFRAEHKNHSKTCPFISFHKKQSHWTVEDTINMEIKRHEFRTVSNY